MRHNALFFALLPLGIIGSVIAGCSADAGSSTTGEEASTAQSGSCRVLDFQTGKLADLSKDHSPFAKLVLNKAAVKFKASNGKDAKCPTTIHEVLSAFDAIPNTSRQIFGVDETGDLPQQSDGGHRFVIAQTTAQSGGTDADVLLAPLEAEPGKLDTESLEVISFDPDRGANVFYKFMSGRWNIIGNGSQIDPQKSQDTKAAAGQFFCQGCHQTGALNFKERQIPWNNWNGFFQMPGFSTKDPLIAGWMKNATGTVADGVTVDPKEPAMGNAYELQGLIEAGNKRLVEVRVKKVLAGGGTGFPGQSLKTLVRELMCDVGEVNLVSSQAHSRLSSPGDAAVPATILADEQLARTVEGANASPPSLTLASYGKAIAKQSIDGVTGAKDAMFALFSPERSFTSELVGDTLVDQGWLTKEALADILMTDFPNPVFSKQRCALAATIPDVAPAAQGSTQWISAWATALQGSSLAGAKGLAKRLSTNGELAAQGAQVSDLFAKCNARATSEADKLAVDIVSLVAQRRVELRADEHLNRGNRGFPQIIESSALLPITSLPAARGALSLQPDCTLGSSPAAIDE